MLLRPYVYISRLEVLISFTVFYAGTLCAKDIHHFDKVMISEQKINVLKIERKFNVFKPTGLKSDKKYPLVLSFHKWGSTKEHNSGSTDSFSPQSVFKDVGEREKFFVVYPQAEKNKHGQNVWSVCNSLSERPLGVDDIQFTIELIDHMIKNYPVDKNRVYAVGMSNGGAMTHRLAMEIPQKLAAVAVLFYNDPRNSVCKEPTKAISMLYMNGTSDNQIPYQGDSAVFYSVKEVIVSWLKRTKLTNLKPVIKKLPQRNKDSLTEVEIYTFKPYNNDLELVHYKINKGGHVEPSLKEIADQKKFKFLGRQNMDFETAEAVWDFFKNKVGSN